VWEESAARPCDNRDHARRPGPDARRELKLRRFRVSAELVLRDLNAAIALVREAL